MNDRMRSSRSPRKAQQARFEDLEGRQLMAASLLPIPDITVPNQVGFQVPAVGGPGAPNQTYTVTTDNNNVVASVAKGKFLTINVTHTASSATDVSFTGALKFQLFEDLTPLTTSRIEKLVTQGFYSGLLFHRVAANFPGTSDFIVQGGSLNGNGTGNVNQPGFPFQDEFNLQLAFTGAGQLAMANAGRDTNESQFFITTGQPRSLDFLHTIFGQLVEGGDILSQMTKVSRNSSDAPLSPITITSATLSDTSPDVTIHLDTTKATPAVLTHVTVTASDSTTHTTASRTFQVNVVPNASTLPTTGPQNERAILAPIDQNPVIGPDQTYTVQLVGADAEASDTLTYTVRGGVTTNATTGAQTFTAVSTNVTATVSATGLLTVKPIAGFTGTVHLLVGVRDQVDHSGTGTLDTPSNFDYHQLDLNVTDQVPSVRLVGNVLAVTPQPRTDGGTNNVTVDESNGNILVSINGTVGPLQPPVATVNRVVVYGTKASDNIQVTPAVDPTIPVTLNGGQGGTNFLVAGSGPALEQGWFGRNTLVGGPLDDYLVGQTGHVHFVKSGGNDTIVAVTVPPLLNKSTHHTRVRVHHFQPPKATFYHFVGNRLVPIQPGSAHAQTTPKIRTARQAPAGRTPRSTK